MLRQDEENFLVIARSAWTRKGVPGFLAFAPLFEVFEHAKPVPNTNPPAGPASAYTSDSTTLYLERTDDVVRGAYSNGDGEWVGWRETTVRIPRTASIGVAAWNTSAKPFVMTFDGFEVLRR
jgi:hypothetical protein